jgi:tRNA 2-selenouridine synthase
MPTPITAEQLITLQQDLPIIDVRSPGEFELGHIPGAFNMPLFDNQERAQVGTRYKNSGRDFAIELGLEYVGPKMAGFVKLVKKLAKDKKLILHCWRGGMRSASVAWLLETAGYEVFLLQGGYKEYRRFNRESFSHAKQLVVLSGYTGSGKTEILKELQKLGEQVIDLEGIAHHKGSAFGSIGQELQPSNEQFENNLAQEWHKLDMNRVIWIEDESVTMGSNGVPDTLFALMRSTKVIRIDIPQIVRAKRLVKEYACFEPALLETSILRIQSKLGGLVTKQALDALHLGDYEKVALIALVYYDKAYLNGLEKRDKKTIESLFIEDDDPAKTAILLKDFLKK